MSEPYLFPQPLKRPQPLGARSKAPPTPRIIPAEPFGMNRSAMPWSSRSAFWIRSRHFSPPCSHGGAIRVRNKSQYSERGQSMNNLINARSLVSTFSRLRFPRALTCFGGALLLMIASVLLQPCKTQAHGRLTINAGEGEAFAPPEARVGSQYESRQVAAVSGVAVIDTPPAFFLSSVRASAQQAAPKTAVKERSTEADDKVQVLFPTDKAVVYQQFCSLAIKIAPSITRLSFIVKDKNEQEVE